MYKIRKVKFQEHPILKNLELDFCGKDGKAFDTIIFAGENGTGKSFLLKTIADIFIFLDKAQQYKRKPKFRYEKFLVIYNLNENEYKSVKKYGRKIWENRLIF